MTNPTNIQILLDILGGAWRAVLHDLPSDGAIADENRVRCRRPRKV